MDFKDEILQFAKRVDRLLPQIKTEEATKTSLIMPFFLRMASDQEEKRINKSSIDEVHKDIQSADTFIFDDVDCKLSQREIIAGIESGRLSLYIYNDGYQKLRVIVSESANGDKYLKIENDSESPSDRF